MESEKLKLTIDLIREIKLPLQTKEVVNISA